MEGSHSSSVCPSGKNTVQMNVSMEHWRNDTDRGKQKYWQIKLYHYPFVKRKISWTGLKSNQGLRGAFKD